MKEIIFHNIDFTYFDAEKEASNMIQSLANSRQALPGLKGLEEVNATYPFYEKQLAIIQSIQEYINRYFIGKEPWRKPIIPKHYLN